MNSCKRDIDPAMTDDVSKRKKSSECVVTSPNVQTPHILLHNDPICSTSDVFHKPKCQMQMDQRDTPSEQMLTPRTKCCASDKVCHEEMDQVLTSASNHCSPGKCPLAAGSKYSELERRFSEDSKSFAYETEACLVPPCPPPTPSDKATDRSEEIAQFLQRLIVRQELNGVCDGSANENGSHKCPILGRTRSLNAPSPIQQFGPCGRIMRNSAMVMTIQDPASQRLTWYKPPFSVLVIKKVRDAQVLQPFMKLIKWLTLEKAMVVFVEASVLDDPHVTGNSSFPAIKEKLMTFREGQDDLTDKIDFIICLGGDGTLLYASSLFQLSVPPVMAFHLGSLGFLTPFKFDNFQEQVTNVLEGHAALTLRSRLRCIIMKKDDQKSKDPHPPTNLLVLNEVVIDRGPSPYLSNIDLYLDGKRITSVQGDGLIVSTPTGSTAYAVAAGASMIHPSVPAIMVTPICPHSLSFRPIVVPAGVELMIAVSRDSRNTAWVSFDGRMRQELSHGDSLRVTTSIYPVPSICAEDQIADWFASLDECLRWNDRKKQRHFDDMNDLSLDSSNHSSLSTRKLDQSFNSDAKFKPDETGASDSQEETIEEESKEA